MYIYYIYVKQERSFPTLQKGKRHVVPTYNICLHIYYISMLHIIYLCIYVSIGSMSISLSYTHTNISKKKREKKKNTHRLTDMGLLLLFRVIFCKLTNILALQTLLEGNKTGKYKSGLVMHDFFIYIQKKNKKSD